MVKSHLYINGSFSKATLNNQSVFVFGKLMLRLMMGCFPKNVSGSNCIYFVPAELLYLIPLIHDMPFSCGSVQHVEVRPKSFVLNCSYPFGSNLCVCRYNGVYIYIYIYIYVLHNTRTEDLNR